MNNQDAGNILTLCNKFCVDNFGNKMNEWLLDAFINSLKKELAPIVQNDSMNIVNIQNKLNECNADLKDKDSIIKDLEYEVEKLKESLDSVNVSN